jgi:hypothetical protein
MTRDEIALAISACSKAELRIMLDATPLERRLMLEAKFYADATISTPPKEVYGVLKRPQRLH